MNFVKTHIYKQEYTDKGLKENIDEARREEEIAEAERLSRLPEFRIDPNFTSLAERLGIEPTFEDEEDDLNPLNIHDAPVVKYEEEEFYEELERQKKEAERERQRQDAFIRNEFTKAKSEREEAWKENVDIDTGIYCKTPVIVHKNSVKSNLATSKVSAVIRKKRITLAVPSVNTSANLIEGYDSS